MFGDVDGKKFECTSDKLGPYACDAGAFNWKVEREVSFLPVSCCVRQSTSESRTFGIGQGKVTLAFACRADVKASTCEELSIESTTSGAV